VKLVATILAVALTLHVHAQTILNGSVLDSASGKPLPARIVIADSAGKVLVSFYHKLPGFFTDTSGRFTINLQPGKYQLDVFRGIDYLSHSETVTIDSAPSLNITIKLARWVPLKEMGWVNGDGHDHLYTDTKFDTLMLDTVRRICLAQGIDFMCTAQGWAGYNDTNWRKGYAAFSDENFLLHYGSEMPKYRTGHTWWLGQTTTMGMFDNTMDTTYENHYYQSEQGTDWTFRSLKFPQVPDIEVVQNFRHYDSALAVIAHPTSWWWQKRGNIEKYVTNVAAYLPFSLLAGNVLDAQVIMGYDRDHYYYQNLWFSVLNEGHRMTPVAELDGGYNRGDKFYYGSMRTYYKVDRGTLTIDKIKRAVRRGRTFVTSGPIVFANIDSSYEIGDVLESNGKEHTLNVSAYASGDRSDYLSYVVLLRNGKPLRIWDLRPDKLRSWNERITLAERENSWYVLKVYGRRAWGDTTSLDVMKYCQKQLTVRDSVGTESDVAITSPFYFRKKGEVKVSPMNSVVDLTISNSKSKEINAALLLHGKVIRQFKIRNGRATFTMPVHAVLKLSSPNQPTVHRTLYLDYAPYSLIMERVASGRWLTDFSGRKYGPGEVPWEAFKFDEAKKLLAKVSWNIDMTPNERDPLWQPFWDTFAAKK
jgi:hypothetical protein